MENRLFILDPVIKKSDALDVFGGNQAQLARILRVSRSYVGKWNEYVPPLQAYRLLQVFPDMTVINDPTLALNLALADEKTIKDGETALPVDAPIESSSSV